MRDGLKKENGHTYVFGNLVVKGIFYKKHTLYKTTTGEWWIDGPTIEDDLPCQWSGRSLAEAKKCVTDWIETETKEIVDSFFNKGEEKKVYILQYVTRTTDNGDDWHNERVVSTKAAAEAYVDEDPDNRAYEVYAVDGEEVR